MAEGDGEGPHDLRRQEPAPELPGRRRAVLVQPRREQRHQRRAPRVSSAGSSRRGRSSSRRSTCRTCWRSRPSTRTGARSAAACRTTWPTATCRRTATTTPAKFKFPRGAILDRNLDEVLPVDAKDPQQVQESIAHSWYEYSDGDGAAKHPWDGETKLNYTGPKPPYEQLDVQQKYSWLKTPRWKGHADGGGSAGRACSSPTRRDARRSRRSSTSALKALDVPVDGALLDAGPHGGARPRDQAGRAAGRWSSTTSCSPTSRTATRAPPTCRSGSRRRGRPRPRASA